MRIPFLHLIISLFFIGNYVLAQEAVNKQMVEDLFLKIWNEQDYTALANLKGDTIAFHLNNYHFKTNKKELSQLVEMWHRSFDNFKFEIIGILAEGDWVAANLRYTGKHVNEFMGTPALGNTIDVSEMMFFRFENGILKEAWELYDEKGMLSQMIKKE